jgi:hypothetical protein
LPWGAVGYIGWNLTRDLSEMRTGSALPYILLGVALLVALAFEFVNGFHDTANAVATVIYTHSLDPHIAETWSGFWNFLGVVTSTGAVAFGIVSLCPLNSSFKSAAAPASRWSSHSSWRPFSGISARGISACPLPAPTHSSVPSSASV